MNRTQRISGALALAAALTLSATGCSLLGGSSTPAANSSQQPSASAAPTGLAADALLSKAVADLGSARTVHMKGTLKQPTATISMDLQLVAGKGCVGTLGQSGKGSFRMVMLGTKIWVMPDAAFLKAHVASASARHQLLGKYIATTVSSKTFGTFSQFCDAHKLAQEFAAASTGITRGAATTVDGLPAVTLSEGDGSQAFVTDTATPQLVRVFKGGTPGGQLDFTDYGKPVTITAPHASLTVPGSKFGG